MAALAGIRPGHTVLDPCRGAGTLLIESALARPDARFHGYGLSVDAVAAARANAGGLPVAVRRSDAGRLPLPDGTVDRWWAELRRVLAPEGTAVLLLPDRDDLATALRHHFTPVRMRRLRLSGARPFLVRLAPTGAGRGRRSRQLPEGRPKALGPPLTAAWLVAQFSSSRTSARHHHCSTRSGDHPRSPVSTVYTSMLHSAA
jgi:SAM-dependent methyltransferase